MHETEGRIGLEQRHLQLELGRQPDVIGIEKRDVLAARRGDAGVACRAGAAVRLADGANAVAVRGEHARRVIGRGVVDHDHLQRRVCLPERAVDGLSHVARVVVRRNDDRNRLHDFSANRSSWPCLSSRLTGRNALPRQR